MRLTGMVVGGGAGALAIFLLAYHAEIPLPFVFGLPGVGLALGTGFFSLRRSVAWGIAAAFAGCAWTVLVLWLSGPEQIGFAELAVGISFTPWGALNFLVVLLVGLLVGAGWEKRPLPSSEKDDDGRH